MKQAKYHSHLLSTLLNSPCLTRKRTFFFYYFSYFQGFLCDFWREFQHCYILLYTTRQGFSFFGRSSKFGGKFIHTRNRISEEKNPDFRQHWTRASMSAPHCPAAPSRPPPSQFRPAQFISVVETHSRVDISKCHFEDDPGLGALPWHYTSLSVGQASWERRFSQLLVQSVSFFKQMAWDCHSTPVGFPLGVFPLVFPSCFSFGFPPRPENPAKIGQEKDKSQCAVGVTASAVLGLCWQLALSDSNLSPFSTSPHGTPTAGLRHSIDSNRQAPHSVQSAPTDSSVAVAFQCPAAFSCAGSSGTVIVL